MTVLVAGGTGRLGRLVVAQLAERHGPVRVLTRDPGRATSLGGGADIVEGDVRRPETLAAACAGVDVVVSAVHGFAGPGGVTPKSVDRDGNTNLISAAQHAGAAVVMVSIVGAAPDSPMELLRYKYDAEQRLQASGVPWTIVRSTAFVELWAELIAAGIVFGRGDNPINFVAVRDVADVVTRAVLEPGLRGRILEVGGPENVSFNELARMLREFGRGRDRVRHIPRPMLRILAPLHRQPRAALVMDTSDMTYRPAMDGTVGATSLRQALSEGATA